MEYCVPLTTAAGVEKVAVYVAPVPLGFVTGPSVATDESTVEPGVFVLALCISTVTVPVEPELSPRLMLIFVKLPVLAAVNVWPAHVVDVGVVLIVVIEVWFWSIASPPVLASFTSPGLAAMSELVPDPVEKFPKFVSVKQLLEPVAVSARFWTVVVPPLTTTPLTDAAL
jgi:hypothetical protein